MQMDEQGGSMGEANYFQVMNLQRQVKDLTEDEVFDSAELLGGFMVSFSAKYFSVLPSFGNGSHMESLVIYGDTLKAKGETKRAIDYYKLALGQRKNVRQSSLSNPSILLRKSQLRSEMENGDNIIQPDVEMIEAQLRFRIARCQVKLKEIHAALKTLEAINPKYQTAAMALTQGRLHSQLGMERATAISYKEGVRGAPYALSGILGLLKVGVSSVEVMELISNRVFKEDLPWMMAFVQGHSSLIMNQYANARTSFLRLKQEIPNQIHVLTTLGEIELEFNDFPSSFRMFHRVRTLDPRCLNGMDSFASLVRDRGDAIFLNALTKELIAIDESRPEPWIAVAMFSELQDDAVTALQFVSKALELDPLHVLGYQLKGALQLRINQPELSVSSMYKAFSLRRDFSAYKGLVNAYLAINKLSEALRTAKEALQLMPKDPRAVLLVGKVLAQTSGDGRKKAIKAYSKALKLDPKCHEAAVALADMHLLQHQQSGDSDLESAILMLTHSLQHQSKDFLHVKLGELYTAMMDYGAAMTQYHNALSMNPDYELAKVGIERLEKLLRGVDPDADEDGDYELENEEYCDQEM